MSHLAIHEERAGETGLELVEGALAQEGKFMHCYRCAAQSADAAFLDSFWKGPEGLLRLNLSEDFFTASGSYDASDPLGQLSVAERQGAGGQQYEIHYQGRITGFTADGLMEIKARGRKDKVYARKRVMMYISEDGKTINVCIDAKENNRKRFHALRAAKAAPLFRPLAWAANGSN